jgi:hypothetical protein
MLLGKDTHPQREIYYLGSLVLELFNASDRVQIDFFDAFLTLNKREKVSMNMFTLTLDWLFMLGAINTEKGFIKKCS